MYMYTEMATSGNLKSGDILCWIISPHPNPHQNLLPHPTRIDLLIDHFLDFDPVSPHKVKAM